MRKSIVAASILAADPGFYHEEIKSITAAGADWIHIDVMDGNFVPPITFGDNIIKTAAKASNLFLDVHLMVNEPEKHLKLFAAAGAQSFTFHQEASKNPAELLKEARGLGLKSGIAIKPATPVGEIQDLIEHCDLILIMTVEPGWGGQAFIPECLEKIKAVETLCAASELNPIIQVDGGINQATGLQCFNAGATSMVAGSYLFQANDRPMAIQNLRYASDQ